MGIQLIMTTVFAATATVGAGCSWAHPGANPYRGDPVSALADFEMPDDTRRQLRALMATHRTTDVATITRDGISGHDGRDQHAEYTDLREMHSGHGQVCHGAVDRSAWSEQRRERALVYCVDSVCVLVPTICNNVSLVTRKPEEHAAGGPPPDDTPIDISPSAGPPGSPPLEAAPPDSSGDSGLDEIASVGGQPGDVVIGGPGTSAGDSAAAVPPDIGPPAGGGGSGGSGSGIGGGDTGGGGTGGGGGGACCVVVPPSSSPTSVPEAPAGVMWLGGLSGVIFGAHWRRRRRAAT